MGEERKERRDYLKSILGIVAGLVIGGVTSWFIKPKEIERVTETLLGPTLTERVTITETIFGPTVTETVTKTVTTPTPTPTILYENHLDSNDDLHRFSGNAGDTHWIPNIELTPDKIIEVSTDTFHSPPYSCKCELNKPWLGEDLNAKPPYSHRRIAARIITMDWKEFYAFSWHYFKSPYANTRPADLMAIKELYPGQPLRWWRLHFQGSLKNFHQVRVWQHEFPAGVNKEWNLGLTLPLDTWFRTGVYVKKHKTNGIIRFYWNDELVFEETGVQTMYAEGAQQWVTVHFNYVSEKETTQFTNYFDDVIISDRFITIKEETALFATIQKFPT